jgi:hypothetical protein
VFVTGSGTIQARRPGAVVVRKPREADRQRHRNAPRLPRTAEKSRGSWNGHGNHCAG